MKSFGKLFTILLCGFFCLTALAQEKTITKVSANGIWTFTFDQEKLAASINQAKEMFDEQSNFATKKGVTNEFLFVDIACDRNALVSNGPFQSDGTTLAPGAPFIVQGWIYPGGTFFSQGPSENGDFPWGIEANGDPTFPELVLGVWTCTGWAHPGSYTSQHFDFNVQPETPGDQTIIGKGQETFSPAPMTRSVLGGTGTWRRARGHYTQIVVAPNNPTGAPNFFMIFEPMSSPLNFKNDGKDDLED